MRGLVLLTALALAPASVARADHRPDRDRHGDREYRERRDYRDGDRYDDGYFNRDGRRIDRRGDRGRWAPIVQQNSATSERQFINVLGRGGRMNRLLVEGVRGAPVIQRVAVEFEDRQTQVWDLNLRLPRGADEVIELGGHKRIHRIVVYTNPSYRGAYSIYGA
jgi:hypothetical protein